MGIRNGCLTTFLAHFNSVYKPQSNFLIFLVYTAENGGHKDVSVCPDGAEGSISQVVHGWNSYEDGTSQQN